MAFSRQDPVGSLVRSSQRGIRAIPLYFSDGVLERSLSFHSLWILLALVWLTWVPPAH